MTSLRNGLLLCMTMMPERFLPVLTLAIAAVVAAAGDRQVIDAAAYVDPALPDCGIQQAIDEAAAAGGTVRIPAGEYRLRCGLILKPNVVLVGAGREQTMLMLAREVERIDLAAPGPDDDGWVEVTAVPSAMVPGSAVVIWRSQPWGHVGQQRPAWIAQIERANKRLKLVTPYGFPGIQIDGKIQMMPGRQLMSFGVALSLDGDVRAGDTEVVLKDTSLLRPGDEIALGEPTNDSRDRQRFIKAIDGDTVTLTEPAAHPLPAWQGKPWMAVTRIPFALHPAIHGWDVKDAAIRDLTIAGHGFETVQPTENRYTFAGIHLFNSERVIIENVTVRDWPSDGFSLQAARQVTVKNCRAENVYGNGFHPGTGFIAGRFEDVVGIGNGTGFYWCWHNRQNVVTGSQFVNNRGGGMTGLGNPADRNNLITDNRFAGNGGAGIAINGGLRSGNIIRNNVIENNSQSAPGKHPGILVAAATEDARDYTIEGNTIGDTQSVPTQWVGIEEQNGQRNGKVTVADDNVIRHNRFVGHRTADIIKSGAATRIDEIGTVKILAGQTDAEGE